MTPDAAGPVEAVLAKALKGHLGADLIPEVAAALAPLFAEHGAAERWPCDDYKPPLTCYTTPKPRTLICQGCREGFPDGPEVRGLHDAHGAAERRAGAVEFADKLYDALLAKPWTPQWGRDDWKRWLSETSAAALGDRADEAVVERCPKCGHAPHRQPCLNMASDNECSCPGQAPALGDRADEVAQEMYETGYFPSMGTATDEAVES